MVGTTEIQAQSIVTQEYMRNIEDALKMVFPRILKYLEFSFLEIQPRRTNIRVGDQDP